MVFGLSAAGLVVWLRMLRRFRTRTLPKKGPRGESSVKPFLDAVLVRLGEGLAPRLRMTIEEETDFRVVGAATVASLLSIPAVGVGAIVPFAAVVSGTEWRHRQRPEVRRREANRDIGLITDLLGITLSSGCNLLRGFEILVQALKGTRFDSRHDELIHQIETVLREVSVGKSAEDALREYGRRCGGDTSRLVGALVASERHGSPIAHSLEQISFEMRLRQQREVEQRAKRASVALAFPLAGCVLPAFALLTVVPLLAGSLGSLAISFT